MAQRRKQRSRQRIHNRSRVTCAGCPVGIATGETPAACRGLLAGCSGRGSLFGRFAKRSAMPQHPMRSASFRAGLSCGIIAMAVPAPRSGFQILHHRSRSFAVKGDGELVGKDRVWPDNKRASRRDPLFLNARKIGGQMDPLSPIPGRPTLEHQCFGWARSQHQRRSFSRVTNQAVHTDHIPEEA